MALPAAAATAGNGGLTPAGQHIHDPGRAADAPAHPAAVALHASGGWSLRAGRTAGLRDMGRSRAGCGMTAACDGSCLAVPTPPALSVHLHASPFQGLVCLVTPQLTGVGILAAPLSDLGYSTCGAGSGGGVEAHAARSGSTHLRTAVACRSARPSCRGTGVHSCHNSAWLSASCAVGTADGTHCSDAAGGSACCAALSCHRLSQFIAAPCSAFNSRHFPN